MASSTLLCMRTQWSKIVQIKTTQPCCALLMCLCWLMQEILSNLHHRLDCTELYRVRSAIHNGTLFWSKQVTIQDGGFLIVLHCQLHLVYTLLTLKYGVNLLNAPESSVLRQNLECDLLQRVNTFSHCVTLTRVLLPQIISCSRSVGSCC